MSGEPETVTRRAVVTTGPSLPSEVELDNRVRVWFDHADEDRDRQGPSSTEGVLAALASCTAVTLEVYASRKEWDLTGLEVVAEAEYKGPNPIRFRVEVTYPDRLDPEQIERLERIAGRCPVHRLLTEATPVEVMTA